MTLPVGAKYEAEIAGGVALYDVSHLMPRHPKKKVPTREAKGIVRQYHHHSGALGAKGYEGAFNSARYVVEQRGFPGAAYTYWLSYEPDIAADRLAIYRLNRDDAHSWHTGGKANAHGVAVCWQGNLSETNPSDAQYEMAEALIPWLIERHGMALPDCLSWHSEAARFGGRSKKTCPGPHVSAWLESYRSLAVA